MQSRLQYIYAPPKNAVPFLTSPLIYDGFMCERYLVEYYPEVVGQVFIYDTREKHYIRRSLMNNGSGYYFQSSVPKKSVPFFGTLFLHRVVAFAWIPNDNPARTIVDHIFGDSLDNRIESLQWATYSENNSNKKNRTLPGRLILPRIDPAIVPNI